MTLPHMEKKDIVSFLCHSTIPIQQENAPLREGRQQKTDMSKMRQRKEEFATAGAGAGPEYLSQENDYNDPSEPVKQEPIRVGTKIGRNDPCPCGSGKKYKQCHGKEA